MQLPNTTARQGRTVGVRPAVGNTMARSDRPLLRSLVAIAVLIPVSVLFIQLWRVTSDEIAFAGNERLGIEYLAALNQVTVTLVDAQSAAVAGQDVDQEALARAVDGVSDVDRRVGDDLRSGERWAALRATIDALPRSETAPAETFAAYSEATDLLLALYSKIRESSNLIRDPEGDTYHLQDGAAEELPEAIVATGRFADLVVLLPTRPAEQRGTALIELLAALSDVLSPADDLANNVQTAVESTDSRTMSSNVLNQLDRFQRDMDTIAAAATVLSSLDAADLGGDAAKNLDQLVQLRTAAQSSAAELATTVITQLDTLISERVDGLEQRRQLGVSALILAILLAVTPAVLSYLARGGGPAPRTGPDGAGPGSGSGSPSPHQGPVRGTPAAQWPKLETVHRDGSEPVGPGAGRRGPTVATR